MNRVLLNTRVQLSELANIPAFTVPSIGLPLVTYLIFGLPTVHGRPAAADGILVGFAAFALLGIVMFNFGVGIAEDRVLPWERYLRTLPSSAGERFTARLIVALCFGVTSLFPLGCAALLLTPLDLDASAWARVLLCLLLGVIPLGLFGIALGYLLDQRGALPVTNLVYLPLSYAGGLFSPNPDALPHLVARLSPWLPTRQWSDMLTRYGLGNRLPVHATLALAGYGVAFALLAIYGYRRDEQHQYR